MATLEMGFEVPCHGRKRESIEDATDVYEDSDYSLDIDSDDPDYEVDGQIDTKIWKQYYKEWEESEGFDISVHPGSSFMAGIEQVVDHLTSPKIHEEFIESCRAAIHHFNSIHGTMYSFQEIVNVNASYTGGTLYYFTFTARDTTVNVTAADAMKTFQAMVWESMNKTIDVHFCRLKKSITNQDKKKKKKMKKSQQDSKAVRMMMSLTPGLVVEELSMPNPSGQRTYLGFKVAVRYTGMLKESGRIFETNIGDEKPLVFRIGTREAIRGLVFGVLGMRVGDKRRITIPPDSGYGDEGYGDIVPPDAWLVYEVELVDINC